MADEMTVPFILGLIGGIFVVLASIAGLWLAYAASKFVGAFGALAGQSTAGITAIVFIGPIVELILAIIIIVGSIMMRNPDKAKAGSILVLVLAIISLINFTAFFGGVIGPILAIVGGALGLSKAK
ncbi:TPA: hypothetical protein H1005_04550 [archaeon]|nr:hypothetical protein [Candidatus Naiadarchaeales archaeon SRR2090153.bin1042]